MSVTPTIEDLKALQHDLRLRDIHVCWLGETTFVIAHTDAERAEQDTTPLEECSLHQWLTDASKPPYALGYYQAHPRMADLDSESYGAAPYEFTPLEHVGGPWLAGDGQSWVYDGTNGWRDHGK